MTLSIPEADSNNIIAQDGVEETDRLLGQRSVSVYATFLFGVFMRNV